MHTVVDIAKPAPRQWALRWRFDFRGDRPSKYGLWSRPGTTPQTQAWCNNAEGLARAAVEGKNLADKSLRLFAECDGWNFVNFKWIATASMPGLARGFGAVTPISFIVGMTLVTREFEIDIFVDGSVAQRRRPDEDKSFNYATFGK